MKTRKTCFLQKFKKKSPDVWPRISNYTNLKAIRTMDLFWQMMANWWILISWAPLVGWTRAKYTNVYWGKLHRENIRKALCNQPELWHDSILIQDSIYLVSLHEVRSFLLFGSWLNGVGPVPPPKYNMGHDLIVRYHPPKSQWVSCHPAKTKPDHHLLTVVMGNQNAQIMQICIIRKHISLMHFMFLS